MTIEELKAENKWLMKQCFNQMLEIRALKEKIKEMEERNIEEYEQRG